LSLGGGQGSNLEKTRMALAKLTVSRNEKEQTLPNSSSGLPIKPAPSQKFDYIFKYFLIAIIPEKTPITTPMNSCRPITIMKFE